MSAPAPSGTSPEGERIYRAGQLPDGSALRGLRKEGTEVAGKDAACVNCHGRSGMGTVEGPVVIPPITAPALFHAGARAPDAGEHNHHLPTPRSRSAYTDDSLARAIRDGEGADGRALDNVMPRYALDDAALQPLLAYLHHLSGGRTPGVVNGELGFATIVTPDADPRARDAMLEVLRHYFAMKNDFTPPTQATRQDDAQGQRYRVKQPWKLHVWSLSGAPDTWGQQLEKMLRAEPVFAVISGIGGKDWAPVHAFCERRALPCLFPNVDVPVVAEGDFYPLYFSRGVLLEADLLSARLQASAPRPGRVVQVYRSDDIGAAGAAALDTALDAVGIARVDRALAPGDGAAGLRQALAQARSGDAIVLWLRAGDLTLLPARAPAVSAVLVSGILAGLEDAPLPAGWREVSRMTYPYALSEESHAPLSYAKAWLRVRHIALTVPRVQLDTYLACSMLDGNLLSTHDVYLRDFLIERIEATAASSLFNGDFKRLSLAPGQRFASKGGYFVRFAEPTGSRVVADGDWVVP